MKNRSKEIEEVNKILGISQTYFLDFPTVKLDTIPQKELINSLLKCLNEIKPQLVYIPHPGDLSKDHRLVFEAALWATKPTPDNSVKRLLSYEILSETEWGEGNFVPNLYEDITNTFQIKLEAMKVYQSELREYPHPRSLEIIEVLAKKRGSEAGLKFAEAFRLIREIRN